MSDHAPADGAGAEADLGRGAQARRALLRAAVEVFGETSLEAATTREIAQRAQQNIAAIAYYFGSKEGLYLAVAEHIAEVIMKRVGPLMDEADAFLKQEHQAPARCLAHIKALLSACIATNQTMIPLTGIIVREQTHPTKAFSILYDGCLKRLHEVGARLIRAYTGADTAECVVRFHALLGAALAFRFARETIMRRAGWKHIGPQQEALIEKTVTEHAELALRGVRAAGRKRQPRR